MSFVGVHVSALTFRVSYCGTYFESLWPFPEADDRSSHGEGNPEHNYDQGSLAAGGEED
jgi:hypothetical protein